MSRNLSQRSIFKIKNNHPGSNHQADILFLAINKKAKLITKEYFDAECIFKEGIFENYWTTYAPLKWGFDKISQIPG